MKSFQHNKPIKFLKKDYEDSVELLESWKSKLERLTNLLPTLTDNDEIITCKQLINRKKTEVDDWGVCVKDKEKILRKRETINIVLNKAKLKEE